MRLKAAALASCLVMSVCTIPSWADQVGSQVPSQYRHGKETKLPNGVIGAVIQVGLSASGNQPFSMSSRSAKMGPPNRQG